MTTKTKEKKKSVQIYPESMAYNKEINQILSHLYKDYQSSYQNVNELRFWIINISSSLDGLGTEVNSMYDNEEMTKEQYSYWQYFMAGLLKGLEAIAKANYELDELLSQYKIHVEPFLQFLFLVINKKIKLAS